MGVREDLHRLVDRIPDDETERAKEVLEAMAERRADPRLLKLATAPVDDEPLTPEEEAAIAEAMEDVRAGHVRPWEEVRDRYLRRP